MKTHSPSLSMPRREFFKPGAGFAALAAAGPLANLASVTAAEPTRGRKSNGIQVGAVSFVDEGTEVDLQGRRAGGLCLCHPDVRAFWTGLATDLCKSYDIDGILFFNERNRPLLNALGASHAQSIASSRVTCFCEHHQNAARAAGISFERAREGYTKLDQFIQAALTRVGSVQAGAPETKFLTVS